MLRYIIIFNTLCVIFVTSMYVVNPGPKYPPTKGELWPKPQLQIKHDSYYNLVVSEFKFTINGETCDILNSAVERYKKVLESTVDIAKRHPKDETPHGETKTNITDSKYLGNIKELQINLTSSCEEYPHMDMDEIYNLAVSSVSTLSSGSIWGILRGMESFVQLFYITDDYAQVLVNKTEIEDFPRYAYRGLLIDTGRHYLTKSNILKTLDGMEMNKMNVLHWHIVDDQNFPYQSEKLPNLSKRGTFDSTMIYTKDDVKEVISYARDRGIRVVPEIDVPGHTRSWGVAYPNILTKCYENGKMIGLGLMDPTKNKTYAVLGELYKEVQDLFPDKYFHIGGDEVELNCWNSNPDVRAFMARNNIVNPKELLKYFMTRVIGQMGNKSIPIVWEEVFHNTVNISKDTLIQLWISLKPDDMIKVLKAGYKVIYSASWYLDQLKNGGDWLDYYNADPRQMIPKSHKDLNLNNIVGGEACMWGEVVDDRNIISRVWPRTSAVAEKLWSAEIHCTSPPEDVYHRLEEHTCRMNRRGIAAQPPNGPGFCYVG